MSKFFPDEQIASKRRLTRKNPTINTMEAGERIVHLLFPLFEKDGRMEIGFIGGD